MEGRVFLGIGLLGYVLHLYLRPGGFDHAGWSEVGTGFGFACLGAAVGKIYGLVRSRLKLRGVISEVRRQVECNDRGEGG